MEILQKNNVQNIDEYIKNKNQQRKNLNCF